MDESHPLKHLVKKRKTLLFLHPSTWPVFFLFIGSFCWLDYAFNGCVVLKIVSNFPADQNTSHQYPTNSWLSRNAISLCFICIAGLITFIGVILAESVAANKKLKIQFSLGMLIAITFILAVALFILKSFGTVG